MGTSATEGLSGRLLELGDQLRREGVAVGTSELLDAFAALREVDWRERSDFREALAATLAKSPEDRRLFELVFERFFFRAVEIEAVRAGLEEGLGAGGGSAFGEDLEDLRALIVAALTGELSAGGGEAALSDLARMAVAALAAGDQSSGAVGVDVQRIRRGLGLRAEQLPEPWRGEEEQAPPLSREALGRFEELLRRELERQQVQRTGELPPARPLGEQGRALPSGPLQDLAAVHRVVAQLRRRLATQGSRARGHRRHEQLDMRHTMRASLQTGGVPVVLRHRQRRPRRPEIYVLCDVSTSVTSASVFFLSVLHALHDAFRRMRSFVFVERVSEVTRIFEQERDFASVSARIAGDAGVADISGYTDYGRVWSELLGLIQDDLGPRSTLIVLGDARTNGRDPRPDTFAQLTARAGRTFWLNPEPRLYWNYGDSVIAAYEPFCRAFECWTTGHLEDFVRTLARPEATAAR